MRVFGLRKGDWMYGLVKLVFGQQFGLILVVFYFH